MEQEKRKPIAAVICNYNKSHYVTDCIQSVLESAFTDFDVIVVDNASTDDSVKCIKEKYAGKVTLLENTENLGGSGGFNTGIRYALQKEYSYGWCLDNDVLVDENAIGELYAFLESHAEAGMAGSKVYHMEVPDYVQQFGIEVDWDDTEWGIRCNLAGYKVASVGASKVLHCMGAKKESVNTFPTYYAWRNWIQFFIKYTKEENLEKMCESFLEGMFEIVYDGWYKGEINRSKTVMYAYDDAIHGVTGKAGENRIFELDKNQDKLKGLLEGVSTVKIKVQNEELYTEELEAQILEINPQIQIWIEGRDDNANELCRRTFVLCRNIFTIKDFSLKDIFVDIEGRILATEEDVLKVLNKEYSYQMFLFTQKPLFMEQAKKLRRG